MRIIFTGTVRGLTSAENDMEMNPINSMFAEKYAQFPEKSFSGNLLFTDFGE